MSEAVDFRRRGGGILPAEPETEHEARVRAERLQIARELHDVVASGFAVVSLQAALAAHQLADHPDKALEALSEIRQMSSEALRELRAILVILRTAESGAFDQPPGVGRIDVLASVATTSGVSTRVNVSGPSVQLPAEVDLAAYRIVQESLTNVLRHSAATSASVLLAYDDDRLLVEVRDDGGGAHSSSPGHGMLGILGMRERAAALGGELDAGPHPQGGFLVRAILPLHSPPPLHPSSPLRGGGR
jgi:signal transduction histidine kinase